MSRVTAAVLAESDALLAQGYALADMAVDALTVLTDDDFIEVLGGILALRDLVVIFRRPVRRHRASDRTPERRKAGDTTGDSSSLLKAMVDTLPDQQFVAVCALIDGRKARTYDRAALLARMSLGAFKQHLHRVRTHYPALYAQVVAYRRVQLHQRHAAAEQRARRHTTAWFWKLRRLEERNEALANRIEAAHRKGLAEYRSGLLRHWPPH